MGAEDAKAFEEGRRAEMAAMADRVLARYRRDRTEEEKPDDDGIMGIIGRGAMDFGRGLIEAPEQVWGGAMDAFSELDRTLESALPLSDWIGSIDIGEPDEEGQRESIFQYLASDPASSATGGAVRGVAQFLTGFVPAMRALRGVGMGAKLGGGAAGAAAEGMVAGAATDFMAFDPHQERLAALLNEVPALQGPVTEWMAENDPARESELEGRIKNTIEGAGLGLVAEGLFAGFRAYRSMRKAQRAAPGADTGAIEKMIQERPVPSPLPDEAFAPIGSREPDAPLVAEEPPDVAELRLAQAAAGAGQDWAPLDGRVMFNFARIEAEPDLMAAIDDLVQMDAPKIDAARRGRKRTHAQEAAEAEVILQDQKKLMEDVIGRPVGALLNAAQMTAARKVQVNMAAQVQDLARAASGETGTQADIAMASRALAVFDAFNRSMIGARSEAARVVSAHRIPVGPPDARGYALQRSIEESGGLESVRARLAAIAGQDTEAGVARATRQVVDDTVGKRLRKAGFEFYVNGLLSGPKTHMVNITSNAMVNLWGLPERWLAGHVARGVYDEADQAAVRPGETAAAAWGTMQGLRDGWRLMTRMNEALDAPSGQSRLYDMAKEFNNSTKVEGIEGGAIRASGLLESANPAKRIAGRGINAFGMLTRIPTNVLQREDMMFKAVAYRQEMNALAHRQAKAEGLEGTDLGNRMEELLLEPPDDLHMAAITQAHYKTFTNQLGPMGQSFQTMAGKVPGARFVLPFIRTPTNIMKFTLARTPLAMLSKRIRGEVMEGGGKGAEALARIGMGTTALLMAAEHAVEGNISGGGSLNRRVAATERRLRPPYSIRVGDQWVSYNRLDPIGMYVGLGADIAEAMGSEDLPAVEELIVAGAASLATNLLSKTYMTGLQEFIAALDSSNPTSDMGKWFIDQSQAVVPYSAMLRNIAQADDPILRDVNAWTGEASMVGQFFAESANRIKRGIPGYSDTLPPRRDIWGEVIDRSSPLGIPWDFLAPMAMREDSKDPVDRVILENDIAVSPVYRRIARVKLTPHEYDTYAEHTGKIARKQLEKTIRSPSFKRYAPGPEGGKAMIVNKVFQKARSAAQAVTLKTHPDLRRRIERSRMEAFGKLVGKK